MTRGQLWLQRHALSLGRVRTRDAVDDSLCLLVTDLLVVVDDVTEVISAAVVRLSDAHRVVREVDIAVVAEEFGHLHYSFARGCACSCSRRYGFGGATDAPSVMARWH